MVLGICGTAMTTITVVLTVFYFIDQPPAGPKKRFKEYVQMMAAYLPDVMHVDEEVSEVGTYFKLGTLGQLND